MSKTPASSQTQEQALAITKATQRPGQSKEQSKLIAKGIEKGIEAYKKQHKAKLREQDKLKKKQTKQASQTQIVLDSASLSETKTVTSATNWLPWILLGLSWLGFVGYFVSQ
ncbi:DUF2956 domain-containing protein [Alginatibacterium sediminis]|uniref:DUF2956 domain-containing protein n=1 Tax=Alginatibacterium sediminis TaxID=2164068 RepID=A0A420EDT3_9ALTE|nr:DUF2956 domain-containing protein [Alginatibacterium sediminis]RKF18857.1 DUF2956 domain-containing protein [Alginatibacterium sediminis]